VLWHYPGDVTEEDVDGFHRLRTPDTPPPTFGREHGTSRIVRETTLQPRLISRGKPGSSTRPFYPAGCSSYRWRPSLPPIVTIAGSCRMNRQG
jgi:hypothetical protein